MTPDKKTVVFFTNSFPNRLQPHRGIYTEQLVTAAGGKIEPVIVCPLPWVPRIGLIGRMSSQYLFARIPKEYDYGRFHVYCPKYPVVPRVPWLSPWFMAASAYPLFRKLAGRKRVEVINAHNVFPEGIAAIWLARRLKVPVVITALGSDLNDAATSRLRLRMTENALRRAAQVTAVSMQLCERMVGMGVEPGRMHFTPNGVDTSLFCPRDKARCRKLTGLIPDEKVLLFVGKFRPVKGIGYLLEALRILREQNRLDFRTVLIGSGPDEREYARMTQAWGLSGRVFPAGNRSHEEIAWWMGASDLFCLPSLQEGMPNVVLEALASGLPVVATRVGAIPDLVNESSGILVPPADARPLARAISEGMGRAWSPEQICAGVQHMSWEIAAARYADIFSRC